MLATVRTFVRQRTGEDPGDTAGVDQLAAFYLATFGPQLDKLDATTVSDRSREIDNIRALIHRLASRDVETAQLLACIVVEDGRRSSLRAAVDEGYLYLEQMPEATPARAALCARLAHATIDAGAPADGSRLLDVVEALVATAGAPAWLDGRVESLRGIVAIIGADYATARSVSLAGLRRASTARGRSYLLNVLAVASMEAGDYAAAREANHGNLDELRALGAEDSCRIPLNNLAEIALRVGDRREAAACQLASLDIALTYGSMDVVAFSLIVAARLRGDDPSIASRLQASADAVLARLGYSLLPSDRQLSENLLDGTRRHDSGRPRSRRRDVRAPNSPSRTQSSRFAKCSAPSPKPPSRPDRGQVPVGRPLYASAGASEEETGAWAVRRGRWAASLV